MISVLYVDDEPAVLEAAKTFLERDGGMAVDAIDSPQVALDKLNVFRYDAIVADYKMPILNGIDLLREIRGRGNRTIFVMFTAHGGEDVATEALVSGADYYIFKRGNGPSDFAEIEGVVRNLVSQRCEDKSIQDIESKYNSLLKRMHNGFAYMLVIADDKGKPYDALVLETNEAFGRITGVDHADIVGTRIKDEVASADGIVKDAFEAIMKVAQTGEWTQIEGYSSLVDRWFDISIYSPEPGHIAAIVSDITEQKSLTRDLEHSRELYRRLFDDFPNPIWRSGLDGKRSYVNPAWTKITGKTMDEELGEQWLENIHPDDRNRYMSTYLDALKSRQPFDIEYRIRSGDGNYVWIVDNGRPFYDITGDFSGFIGSCYDVTRRKQNDEAVQLANRKLKILGSITRHDLLNQLTALTGYVGIVQERLKDKALNNYLDKAMLASENIKNYLDFGRDYEKMGTNRPEWQRVKEAFEKGTSTVQISDIRVMASLDNLEIFADQMLEKVFHNLLDNAYRHGLSVKNINFSYSEREDGLVIVCEDDGVGIPKEKRDLLFSNRYGHGLYLVQEILGITNMTIKETGRPGGGAHFEIQVPKGNYRISD